jgi:1-acyl-sn-glycerol-3-phosphate acyltransferase
VLLKKELMSIPILGTAMKMGGFIPVERGSRRDAAQASVAAAAKAIADGLSIVVFPEGTRAVDGRLASFKKGPFFLAMQAGAPIVPVAISGTETMMRKGSSLVTPGVATIRMLAPIEPAAYPTREALMAAVHAAIAEALPDAMKPT